MFQGYVQNLSKSYVLQFLLYIDSTGLSSPMEIETDSVGMDDVSALKKTLEEEAIPVNTTTHWIFLF